MTGNVITEVHLERYLSITKRALEKLKIVAPQRSFGRKLAEDFLVMARSYYEDALTFRSKGDFVNAFACVNYAHGWLDCGARLGLFDVREDDQLFTLYE
ncbi:MAG: DUF357 domain-containing protein [Methanomassiliicoccales archaeon]